MYHFEKIMGVFADSGQNNQFDWLVVWLVASTKCGVTYELPNRESF